MDTEREVRRLQGKRLRKACPRAFHVEVVLGQGDRDPLPLLEESNHDRLENLIPLRWSRMLESAFAFFRGSAILQAYDLKGTPASGVIVQCCGDCHLMNFGGFATPERTLVFDINDFDETFPGPFEWDVKRLATSLVMAARWHGFGADVAQQSAESMVAAYRTSMARFARLGVLEVWYSQTKATDLVEEFADDPEILQRFQKAVGKATQNSTEAVFNKIATVVDGQPRIVDQPPLIFHLDPSQLDFERDVLGFFKHYRKTLPRDRQVLFARFRIVDAAYKVVGVGSVGTRCFVVLLMADHDDPLFLQVKEARSSVLEGLNGESSGSHNGERVVTGQRLMQSASDIFLGWSTGPHGREYYVRQLRDMKVAPNLAGQTPLVLTTLGQLCGRTLARAHAKAGDAAMIAGYLGTGTNFDEAIARYAVAYADQVEKDFESFRAAVTTGRFAIESLPSDTEQAIR